MARAEIVRSRRRAAAVLVIVCVLAGAGMAGAVPEADGNTRVGPLDLHFEPNVGQAPAPEAPDRNRTAGSKAGAHDDLAPDRAAAFVSRGRGYRLALGPDGLALRLRRGADEAARLRLRLEGASPSPRIEGEDLLPGRSHYLRGSNPSRWTTEVPHFARVRYREVYRGVDLVFYGNDGRLEHDFVLAPGVDPSRIRIRIEGARSVEIAKDGALAAHVAGGSVRFEPPVAWEETPSGRKPVASRYALGEDGVVGFRVASRDPRRTLVIDPILTWSTYLGGSGGDAALAVAAAADGSAWIAGATESPDFPGTSAPAGGVEAFVARISSDGRTLLSATYLGGSGDDVALGLALDPAGRPFVTGLTTSADYPLVAPLQAALGGSMDAFVTRLSADGAAPDFSTYLGGSDLDQGSAIAVDGSGAAYLTGVTASTDFPTVAAVQPAPGSFGDAFVAKIDAGALAYSTYLGGDEFDAGYGIAVDAAGSAVVTGETGSTDFPTANAFRAADLPDIDAFVTRLSPDGSSFVYSTYFGGGGIDVANAVAVDADGEATLTGWTDSTNFPRRNALRNTIAGLSDAFVTRLDAAGQPVFSTYLGGGDADTGWGIALDGAGNVHVSGETYSSNFPQTPAAFTPPDGGPSDLDAFAAKLRADGRVLLYSTYVGGIGNDTGWAVAVTPDGSTLVAGETAADDFPTAPADGPAQGGRAGSSDAFVARLDTGDDGDDDFVPDGEDNCPLQANPGQADGDADGVGDVCDPCPTVPDQTSCSPPSIAITRPAGAATFVTDGETGVPSPTGFPLVVGGITACADVTDDGAVDVVEMRLDGGAWADVSASRGTCAACGSGPDTYCHTFDAGSVRLGDNQVRVRATDADGLGRERSQFFTGAGSASPAL